MAITEAERKAQVEEAAQAFSHDLLTGTGAQLDGVQRWAVCAATCVALSCTGCAELPSDTCLRTTDTNIFQLLNELKHDDEQAANNADSGNLLDKAQVQLITTLVHSIVNHQGRIDEGWHDEALHALKDCHLLDKNDKNESQVQSALVEIITLTGLTHAFNVALLLLGKPEGFELPSLDKVAKNAPTPPRFDPQDLLKPGETLTRDDDVARSAFFVTSHDKIHAIMSARD
jgi:hypothetical protein